MPEHHAVIEPLAEPENTRLVYCAQPILNIFASHVFCQAITLLNFAFELVAPSVDLSQVVISELAPLLSNLSFGLLPISLDAVPVHVSSPLALSTGRSDNLFAAGRFPDEFRPSITHCDRYAGSGSFAGTVPPGRSKCPGGPELSS
jgi:hypothetical protein